MGRSWETIVWIAGAACLAAFAVCDAAWFRPNGTWSLPIDALAVGLAGWMLTTDPHTVATWIRGRR